MATITFTEDMPQWGSLLELYTDNLHIDSSNSKKATLVDDSTHNEIVLKGSDLSFDGDTPISGHVDTLIFRNSDMAVMINVEDADIKIKPLMNALNNNGFDAFAAKLLAGDDTFFGSSHGDSMFAGGGDDRLKGMGGVDFLAGGLGDDRLIGGASTDYFIFEKGDGNDVVVDFDSKGGGDLQDYIWTHSDVKSITKDGDDTVVSFGGGNTLTLRDVNFHSVTIDDFGAPAI